MQNVVLEIDELNLGNFRSETDDEVMVELLGSGKQVRLSKDDVQKANPPKFDRVRIFSPWKLKDLAILR